MPTVTSSTTRSPAAPRTSASSSGTSRPDPDLKRGYNWEYSVSVQHELMPKVSITGGYYRRKFGNLRVNDNLNLTPDRLELVHASLDRRMPGSRPAAARTITMYSLNRTKSARPPTLS